MKQGDRRTEHSLVHLVDETQTSVEELTSSTTDGEHLFTTPTSDTAGERALSVQKIKLDEEREESTNPLVPPPPPLVVTDEIHFVSYDASNYRGRAD